MHFALDWLTRGDFGQISLGFQIALTRRTVPPSNCFGLALFDVLAPIIHIAEHTLGCNFTTSAAAAAARILGSFKAAAVSGYSGIRRLSSGPAPGRANLSTRKTVSRSAVVAR